MPPSIATTSTLPGLVPTSSTLCRTFPCSVPTRPTASRPSRPTSSPSRSTTSLVPTASGTRPPTNGALGAGNGRSATVSTSLAEVRLKATAGTPSVTREAMAVTIRSAVTAAMVATAAAGSPGGVPSLLSLPATAEAGAASPPTRPAAAEEDDPRARLVPLHPSPPSDVPPARPLPLLLAGRDLPRPAAEEEDTPARAVRSRILAARLNSPTPSRPLILSLKPRPNSLSSAWFFVSASVDRADAAIRRRRALQGLTNLDQNSDAGSVSNFSCRSCRMLRFSW